jgi:hypothetical protein
MKAVGLENDFCRRQINDKIKGDFPQEILLCHQETK